MDMLGRLLIILGVVIFAVGVALTLGSRIPLIGRLPGDFEIRGEGWTVYLPIATSILLSIVITLVLAALGWLGGRR